jgi:hypothetical protein
VKDAITAAAIWISVAPRVIPTKPFGTVIIGKIKGDEKKA